MIEQKKIKEIAFHYGSENRLMKLSKKCFELAYEAKWCSINREVSDKFAEIIAEVLILISQVSCLTLVDNSVIYEWMEHKVNEQLRSIKYGEDE